MPPDLKKQPSASDNARRLSNDSATNQEQHISIDAEQFIRMAMLEDPKKGCELLFRRYHKILCNHAVRFVYSKEIAEDIVSEVFCRLWKFKSYASIRCSYRFYLLKCVRNASYNYLRLEFHKHKKTELGESLESSEDFRPDNITHAEEMSRRIQELIEELPPQCRKIFLLNRFEGKKYQLIADELKISIKTVEGHISKALVNLRAGLRDYWITGIGAFFLLF